MTVKARLLWDDLGNEVRIAQVPVHTATHTHLHDSGHLCVKWDFCFA